MCRRYNRLSPAKRPKTKREYRIDPIYYSSFKSPDKTFSLSFEKPITAELHNPYGFGGRLLLLLLLPWLIH